MENGLDIFNTSEYQVNKGFYRQVKGPLSYLIKEVGVDPDQKKVCDPKTRICKDQGEKGPNEKYASITVMFFLLKTLRRRRVRNELKKKRHEELEQAV
jgi:hypothetical protein